MAARKKLTEFEKRSKASKKGWKTRRKHVAIAKTRKAIRKEQTLVANVRIVQGKPKKPNPRIGKPNDELKKLRKRLKDVEVELAEQIELSKFVDSRSSEYLHRDFSIAVHPCRLRHLEESDSLRKAMLKARKLGQKQLGRMAHDIAEFYNLPIKEVYTLFWSP